MNAESVMSINEGSKVADVVAYVGQQLGSYEFVEDLQQFILAQRIGGTAFLALTIDKLKEDGMVARGDREELLGLVKRTTGDIEKPIFISSPDQLKLCFDALEASSLRDFLDSYDETEFLLKHPFLYAHRLGMDLESCAAVELSSFIHTLGDNTAMLIGVSGCGKSHAIYKNAVEMLCLYFTPEHRMLTSFVSYSKNCRNRYAFKDELEFRLFILEDFEKRLTCRYIVLKFLLELSWDFETLFFLQSTSVLEAYDIIVYELISTTFSKVSLNLKGSFVAVDECQLYFTPEFDILFRTGFVEPQPISFCRYFSWFARFSQVKMILSGTALKLRHIDRLGSGDKPLSVYGIQVISTFDYLDSARISEVSTLLLGEFKDSNLLNRMSELLQGRPRILMNFILQCDMQNTISLDFLDEYCTTLTENGVSGVWSLIKLWKDLFEGLYKRDFKVDLQFRDEQTSPIDIQSCFIKILVDSLRYLDENLEYEQHSIRGSWFTLKADEVASIELGVCPLLDVEKNKYMLMEPLTIISGIHYIMKSPALRSSLLDNILSAMFAKGATPQTRGSYFDLFVALKVSLSAEFREGIFQLAIEEGVKNDSTQWISQLTLPDAEYFKLMYKASDAKFVESFENDGLDVLLPSVLAGPDVQWWVFVFALKTTWSKDHIANIESGKNYDTCNPEQFFSWRSKRKYEEGTEPKLSKKRKLLNEKCRDIATERQSGGYGSVRVRIELPFSSFVSPRETRSKTSNLTSDICLCLDWDAFSILLSDEEKTLFMAYLKLSFDE